MGRILGLDLGTNSVGWAIIDANINDEGKVLQYKSIIDSGVRIFPEGIDPDTIGTGEKEKSRNAERREHRQSRRLFYRKRLRKIKLLELLIKYNMCPLTTEELKQWKYWDKNKKSAGRKFPNSREFTEWLKLNPYDLRKRALEENISLYEMGRVLYHLIQRRGFVSSRKDKDAGAIFKGKDDKTGISETKEKMGNRTLGQYLYTIIPAKGEPYKEYRDAEGNILRARSRYTLRDMYIEELYKIWKRQSAHLGLDKIFIEKIKTRLFRGSLSATRTQNKINKINKKYGPNNVQIRDKKIISKETVPLFEYLAGEIWEEEGGVRHRNTEESVLFWQRPLRSQKALLNKCRFEHRYIKINENKTIIAGKSPCYLSHPDFELFRTFQFVNNIEFGTKQKLNQQQKNTVIELINSKKTAFDFNQIIKKLKLQDEKFNYDNKFSVAGNSTIAQLKPLFPENVWQLHYHDIWHCFLFYDDNERLFHKLKKDYACICEKAEDIEKISLKDGYANVSLKAIGNINPFLKKGYNLSEAVILGGIKNAFGKEQWDKFASEHDKIEQDIVKIMRQKNAEGEMIQKIKAYLVNGNGSLDFGFKPEDPRLKKLYHPSVELQKTGNALKQKLSPLPNLRNPLVQRSLSEMRHVVNALIDEYGSFDIVKIEMGRDLKSTKEARREMHYKNFENKRKNDEAREKLTEYGLAHSRQNIRKYLLYREIEEHAGRVVCPYTGKMIRINDLLGTGNLFQIEHIVPFSISLDDSIANITLCESNFNREKGEKTPYEFYKSNPDPVLWGGVKSWEEIEMRAFALLPYAKAKRFTNKKPPETDTFITRQLNDTRYISKEAVNIMKEICHNVLVLPGKLTAELRYLWGINNVLQPVEKVEFIEGDYEANEKTRTEHWALVNKDGEFISVHKKLNKKPSVPKGYCLYPGYVKKGVFISEFSEEINAESYTDGKYWCKTRTAGDPEFFPMFNKRPEDSEKHIVLKGIVSKQKFINDSIGKALNTTLNADGSYWGVFTIESLFFTGSERPKKKAGQIALFGNIKNGRFSSYRFQCNTEHEDGGSWVLLNINTDNYQLYKIKRDAPSRNLNQVVMTGIIDNGGVWISDDNPDMAYATALPAGKYWARFDIVKESCSFISIINLPPKPAGDQKLIDGDIWIDNQGEVRFEPKKNREDQRHHAIDAMAIACTERAFLQKLSHYHADMRERYDGYNPERPHFDIPWQGFRDDVQRSADKILVSYYKNNKALDRSQKYVYKNGQKYLAKMSAVRGQLHKDTVFGKRTAPDGRTAFHVRKPITSLKSKTHVEKVVDPVIRKMIEDHLKYVCNVDISKKYDVPPDAFYKDGQYRIKLPNKNGEEVPVKKVRMREEIGNSKQLKNNLNQYVNPRNNHHVMIYKDHKGELKESIVTFWEVVHRKNRGEDVYQLPDDGKEIIAVMEINDMFLLNLPSGMNVKATGKEEISRHLFRIQKLSSGDYFFRHHLASTLNNSEEERRVASMNAWKKSNPQKVKINTIGKIVEY